MYVTMKFMFFTAINFCSDNHNRLLRHQDEYCSINSIVDIDGNRLPFFEPQKQINSEFKKRGETLMTLDCILFLNWFSYYEN